MSRHTAVVIGNQQDEPEATGRAVGSEQDLLSDDALRQYLKNLHRVPLLSAEGEVALGKQLAEGRRRVLAAILGSSQAVAELLGLRGQLLRREVPLREVVLALESADESASKEPAESPEPAAHTAQVLRILDEVRQCQTRMNRIQRLLSGQPEPPLARRRALEEELGALRRTMFTRVSALALHPKLLARLSEHVKRGPQALAAELTAAEQLRDSAYHRLVRANLRLVVAVARRYTPHHMQLLDLIQDGNLGLMRAVEKFDYQRGCRFSTYAVYWIRQAVMRGIFDQSRTVRLPVHVWEQARRLHTLSTISWCQLGREPTTEELAAQSGLKPTQVQHVLSSSAKAPISIDYPASAEQGVNLGDLLVDTSSDSPSEGLEKAARSACLQFILKELHPRERKVLRLRLGLDRGEQKTLEEVGKSCGVSRERARRLEGRALLKLRRSPQVLHLKVLLEA